jgi:hypothetical protein
VSALPWIAGGLGLGVLYYLWQRNQTAAPNDYCATLCKAAGSFCVDGGWSCRETNTIVGGFLDPGGAYYSERDRREGVNTGLNGAADIVNSPEGVSPTTQAYNTAINAIKNGGSYEDIIRAAGAQQTLSDTPQPIGAKTLRYKNGCVPLFDAPGFASCKPGTLDMYATAINVGANSPYDLSEANLVEMGAYVSAADRDANQAQVWQHVNKNNAMTGGSGDPATQGPFGTNPGAPYWYVRGQVVTGTATTAPRAVVMQHFAIAAAGAEQTTDQQIANLSDAQAVELVPINTNPTVIQTQIGVPCGTINPGYSWIAQGTALAKALGGAGGYWARTAVGQTDKPAPCAQISNTNATVSHTLDLGP